MESNECMDTEGCSSGIAATTPEVAQYTPLNASKLKERRQRKKLRFKKLEKKLEILDRQIKKCAEAEISLEEMESGYSAYIKEDLLKRKFVKTWQELCQLQRVSDGIVIEDKETSAYDGTPYPEVNRRVQRLLRQDEFPDYIDIVQLLDRCNTKHGLGIATEEKSQLARKVFKDVGKMMKRSRQRDFIHHFGSHLTDNFSIATDPAEKNEDLLMELQKSMKEGEKKMETIVEEFVIKQEQVYGGQRTQDGDSCSGNEQEDDEQIQEDDEERPDDEKDDDDELLVNGDSECEIGHVPQDLPHPAQENSKRDEEELKLSVDGGSSGEERDDKLYNQSDVIADSTTIHIESPEVTSTQQKEESPYEINNHHQCSTMSDQVCCTSSSDVVCLDDSDEVIILSDSDPS